MRDDLVTQLNTQYEISENFNPFRFVPPGPVSQAFMRDQTMTLALMGPLGGGKTTSCAFKRIQAACEMPVCKDGVKRDRFIVVRDNFRVAERTVLRSWQQWFPKNYPGSHSQGGNDRPFTHTLRFREPDGIIVEAETIFLGLNGQSLGDLLRGMEISGGWINEGDTLDEEVLRNIESRTGRYPSKVDLADENAPRKRTVVVDFNAPSIDNWTYNTFVEHTTPDRKLYRQPSGRSPDAENVKYLEDDYYSKIIANEPEWYVRRFVDNEFGYSRDGKPVYEAFDQRRHIAAKNMTPDQNLPLLMGFDAGLTPAAVFAQPQPDGQLRITDEIYPGHGYGASRFAEMVAEVLASRYPHVPNIQAWCDPAAQYGADKEGGELAWIETVSLVLELPVLVPANGSNEIGLRIDAVTGELTRYIDGETPRLLISPHCHWIVQGFVSKYRYRKRGNTSSAAYEPTPDKNDWSHAHDALQYLVLGYRGRNAVVRQSAAPRRAHRLTDNPWGQRPSKARFDVHKF